jgi:hypothetical protein
MGQVQGDTLQISDGQVSIINVTIADMKAIWSTAIERRLEI